MCVLCLKAGGQFQIMKQHKENNHLPQFDKAMATELKSLVDSGSSRTTPFALRGAITLKEIEIIRCTDECDSTKN